MAWQQKHPRPFDRGEHLALKLTFVFNRPASHYGTGRNAALLKASAPAAPFGGQNGGDVDNLAKLVMDALEGVAYANDSQIADLRIVKRYAGPDDSGPFTAIQLRPLD